MIFRSSFTKLILNLALVHSLAIATGGQAYPISSPATSATAFAQHHYGQIGSSAAAYAHAGLIQPSTVVQPSTEKHQPQPMMTQSAHEPQHQEHQATSIASMPMDQLLQQLTMSNYQTGGTNMHYNNHVSNIKVGNHESTNINNINNNLDTSVTGSQLHSDVGNKNINALPTTNFGANSVNTYSAGQAVAQPISNVAVGANGFVPEVKVKASQEQKDLKKRLIDLAQKIANQAHDVSHPDESLVKLNKRTGLLTPLPVDPNIAINKAKLDKALRALSSKKLPVDRLKEALGYNLPSEVLNDHYLVDQPMYLQPVQPEPEPEPEMQPEYAEPEQIAAADPEMVEQVRAVLDDRINRISDLLYFRPEYLNQMLHVDDQNDLTPIEAEFKRMVLCNSDEQFCGQDLSQWAQRQAGHEPVEHYDEDPAYEHVPEAEPLVTVNNPFDDNNGYNEVAYAPRRQIYSKEPQKLVMRAPGVAKSVSQKVAQSPQQNIYRPQSQQQPMKLVVQNQPKPLGPNPYGGDRRQQQQQQTRQKVVRDLNQQQKLRSARP